MGLNKVKLKQIIMKNKTAKEHLKEKILNEIIKNETREVVTCYQIVHYDKAIEAMESYAKEKCYQQRLIWLMYLMRHLKSTVCISEYI